MTAQQREFAYSDWRAVYDAEIAKWEFTRNQEGK